MDLLGALRDAGIEDRAEAVRSLAERVRRSATRRAHVVADPAEESRTPVALWVAVADVPVLVAEIARGRALLVLSRAEYADLLAAARATVAAERDGEREPLWYLRDELATRGQLPPKYLGAVALLALGTES